MDDNLPCEINTKVMPNNLLMHSTYNIRLGRQCYRRTPYFYGCAAHARSIRAFNKYEKIVRIFFVCCHRSKIKISRESVINSLPNSYLQILFNILGSPHLTFEQHTPRRLRSVASISASVPPSAGCRRAEETCIDVSYPLIRHRLHSAHCAVIHELIAPQIIIQWSEEVKIA